MKKTCDNCKHLTCVYDSYGCNLKKIYLENTIVDDTCCSDWSDIRLCPFCHNMPEIETEFSFKSAIMFKDGYVMKCNCGIVTKPFKTQKALKQYWNGENISTK